jgi:hypothetical protein
MKKNEVFLSKTNRSNNLHVNNIIKVPLLPILLGVDYQVLRVPV